MQAGTPNNTHSTPSHERLRAEIEQQVEAFLRRGGQIEVMQNNLEGARPIGPVWWDTRGSGMNGVVGR